MTQQTLAPGTNCSIRTSLANDSLPPMGNFSCFPRMHCTDTRMTCFWKWGWCKDKSSSLTFCSTITFSPCVVCYMWRAQRSFKVSFIVTHKNVMSFALIKEKYYGNKSTNKSQIGYYRNTNEGNKNNPSRDIVSAYLSSSFIMKRRRD